WHSTPRNESWFSMSGVAFPFPRLKGSRTLRRIFQPKRNSSATASASVSDLSLAVFAPSADSLRQRNFELLLESLDINGNPSRVWNNYTNAISTLGYERLPVELHQEVLRKCTPTSTLLRANVARRMYEGKAPPSHKYEDRFKTIIRNMRLSGYKATVGDYNFILEQFAAVGHHTGAMKVYSEMNTAGIAPRTRTFGLLLQAIAHRLTMPVAEALRAERTLVTRRMVSDLVNDMKTHRIPFTSVNLDLTMRILKETTDLAGFEALMRWGYGIDLANPDCPPLEYIQGSGTLSNPQPFSTAALNMTLDTLGRLKNIPRMVQAFEVLTAPLPKRPPLEDDEEEQYSVLANASFVTPHALPNTTTYNILIRHLSQAGHGVFARHYLLCAMELERTTRYSLRLNIENLQFEEIPAPHFAINRGTLLSVFGHSNRDRNIGLMRWLHTKMPDIISRKRGELLFLSPLRERRRRLGQFPYDDPNYIPVHLPPKQTPSRADPNIFDLDIDDERGPPPAPSKLFNLDLHMTLLQRDLGEIEALYEHVTDILHKRSMQQKDRLGRRVSRGKDLYFRSTEGRKRISGSQWQEVAGYHRHGQARPKRFEHYVIAEDPSPAVDEKP
ncbi:unnamed protein product, partial [Mycena citricolor]